MMAEVKRSPVTYMWRVKTAPGWAAETRLLPVVQTDGEERTSLSQWECNGTRYGITKTDKSDLVLIPYCLGNGGANRGGLALCESYIAAEGAPSNYCNRPAVAELLSRETTQQLGLQMGFTVTVDISDPGTTAAQIQADPTKSSLAKAVLNAQLQIASIRAGEGCSVEIVVDMADPLAAADQCELVQAICAGFANSCPRVTEAWISTTASRDAGGVGSLLSRLTAASNKAGVSANSRSGRFYIPASVARTGSGHYIDQQPAKCVDTYQYVRNAIDLWAEPA
jgi:hypothetical protein